MEDSEALERLENRIRRLSNGEEGHEAEAEATKSLKLIKLRKGYVLCEFLVGHGVSDESGKWHEGAMTTLIDAIGSWTAFSFTSHRQITVYLSVSFYSSPNLLEVVEVEGRAMGKKGRMTSVRVEVRTKHDAQTVALAIMWNSPSLPINHKPLSSKL